MEAEQQVELSGCRWKFISFIAIAHLMRRKNVFDNADKQNNYSLCISVILRRVAACVCERSSGHTQLHTKHCRQQTMRVNLMTRASAKQLQLSSLFKVSVTKGNSLLNSFFYALKHQHKSCSMTENIFHALTLTSFIGDLLLSF